MSLEETQQLIQSADQKMGITINNLKKDLTSIHAGQVSPTMLDALKVDYYGNPTPVNQVANISTPEPQMLAISPWEKSLIKEIERSLQSANLGFSISNDGNIIRAVAPPFTEERRTDYVKQIKKIGEETKIALGNKGGFSWIDAEESYGRRIIEYYSIEKIQERPQQKTDRDGGFGSTGT